MEKYIWGYIVMCDRDGWEHCRYWMYTGYCECNGINAAFLCRMGWNPSDWGCLEGSLMQAVCLSVLSLCLSWSSGESTVMPFFCLWWSSQWARLYLGAAPAVGLRIPIMRRNQKFSFSFCVAIFLPVFRGVSGNVINLLCKFSYNSCPRHSQLSGFLMASRTANWSAVLWLRAAVAAFLPQIPRPCCTPVLHSRVPSASPRGRDKGVAAFAFRLILPLLGIFSSVVPLGFRVALPVTALRVRRRRRSAAQGLLQAPWRSLPVSAHSL